MIAFKYTTLGLAAIAAGDPLVIDEVAFGNSGYEPSTEATALQSEQVRVVPNSAIAVGKTITLITQISGALEFPIKEIGIYLANGVLLCLYSHPTETAGEKVAGTIFNLTIVLQLNGVQEANITFSINAFAEAELHTHINDSNGHGINDHMADKSNPHNVTNAQVGGVTPADLRLLVPAGSIISIAGVTIPAGYFECNGAELARFSFADLFSVCGTTYGAGDGFSTFNLPDLRGEFIRGWDHYRGVDVGRLRGSAQSDAFKSHSHSYTRYGDLHRASGTNSGHWINTASGNTGTTGSTETRPRNIALMYCIKF